MRKRQLLAFLFAALAVAARLPFLVTGKIPFDSDEAVEGLMARHVLNGELPAFFWGQAFKGVPEVYAAARERRRIASAIVAAIIAVHAWQQVIWYQKLQPDTASIATIECLKRNGIRGGYAEYWTAYKLTFVAQEEIVIAPIDGIDRYPPYTEYVRSLPAHQ